MIPKRTFFGIKNAVSDEMITTGMTTRREIETIFISIRPYRKKPRVALLIPNDWVMRPMITLSAGLNPEPARGRITEKKGTNRSAPLSPSMFTTRAIRKAKGNTQRYDVQKPVSPGTVERRMIRKRGIMERTRICSYSKILDVRELFGI